ncbi:hypothetical protein DFH28DRAFT_939269 [Melampsora americana]|nr:hypothetical protein DFH28DRAFT_939269 [Melampsora americana]
MSNSFAQDFPSPSTVDMETPHGSPEPDPTQQMDVSPRPAANFAAPTFEAFAQAPTSSGPLSNIQESGLSEAEFEEITKEEFERNISATAHVLRRQAAQICESRIHDLRRGIHPPAIDGVKVIDLTGEGTPAPTQPRRSSRPGSSSSDYSKSQSSTKKRARLSLKRNAEDIEEEEEDNLSEEQPLETGDDHGTTSAEHDDSLVTEDHHDELETAPPRTNPIQPPSQKSSQSVLFELEEDLLQERKKEALLNNQPIRASFVTSPSAINPALITQTNPARNTGNISNPPLSPAHDDSTAQSQVPPSIQSDSQSSPTRSAVRSITPPPINHPASPTPQTVLPQSSAAPVSPNPPASPTQPLIEDTTATSNISASTFPRAQNQQSPQTGTSPNNSNNQESAAKNTPEEQLAALDLDSMDIDLPVPCLLPEIDPSLVTGTESNTRNLFKSKRDVFVAAFKKFPIRMTPAKYSEGRDLVLKLLELRLKHIPTIINPKYLLPKGFKFHDTTLSGTAWLSELNQQGVDFASPHEGELLFNSDIWSPWLFETKEDPPKDDEHSITFQIYRYLRPIAKPSVYYQMKSCRVFRDAIVVASDEVTRKEEFVINTNCTEYEKSFALVTHLFKVRPSVGSVGLSSLEGSSQVKSETLGQLNNFATRVHDILLGVAILDLFAKLPKAKNNKEHLKIYEDLNKQIKVIKDVKFVWGMLGSFLISGVRGLLFTSDNCKTGPAATVLAVVQAAADIQKQDRLLFKETIWVRTHDYIMRLLSKNYNYFKGEVSAPQSAADFAYVKKGPLAICLAYDIGYYWSMKVPTSLGMGLPRPYLAALKLKGGASIESVGNGKDEIDLAID